MPPPQARGRAGHHDLAERDLGAVPERVGDFTRTRVGDVLRPHRISTQSPSRLDLVLEELVLSEQEEVGRVGVQPFRGRARKEVTKPSENPENPDAKAPDSASPAPAPETK